VRKTVHRFARLIPLVAVAAALMVPTVALAADTSIQPQSAKLVAKGTAVDVTIGFTCPAGYKVGNPFGMPGGANVYIQQAVSRTQQAAGSGFTSGQTCTGQPQTAVVRVLANVPGAPFRRGPAVASADLQACDANFNCVYATSGPLTIRISR
jgi:hypothetical protein